MTHQAQTSSGRSIDSLMTELLILSDGRILVHNLTQPFAELLRELNPDDEQIPPRAARRPSISDEPGRADLPVSRAAQQRHPTGVKLQSTNPGKCQSHELPN